MNGAGWTAIARKLWTDPQFPRERWCERAAWAYLISRARFEDGEGLRRGQLIVSASDLASLWLWETREVTLALQRFRRRGWLTLERRGHRLTVITLSNWDKYQAPNGPNPPKSARQERDKSETRARQGRDGQSKVKQVFSSDGETSARLERDKSETSARRQIRTGNREQETKTILDPPSTIDRKSEDGTPRRLDDGKDILAVPSSVVVAMGRTEDGAAYVRFGRSGPGKPVTRALRQAGFIFDADAAEWVAVYTKQRAALLGRIHPEGTKIMHREAIADEAGQPGNGPADTTPAGEDVAAFFEALDAASLSFLANVLAVESVAVADGTDVLELASSDAKLVLALNAFGQGAKASARRRDELAEHWTAATGRPAIVAPVRFDEDAPPRVVQLSAARERRAKA